MLPSAELLFAVLLALVSVFIYSQSQQLPAAPPLPPRSLTVTLPARTRRPPPPPATMPPAPFDADAIARIFTDLYHVLIDLAYIDADDIVWPPADGAGQPINGALCDELHLAPAVQTLLRKLPYPRDRETAQVMHIFRKARPFCYLDDDDLRASRDPDLTDTFEDLRLDYLLPGDVALTTGAPDGYALVLDTAANTLRRLENTYGPPGSPGDDSSDDGSPDPSRLERPDDPEHYRNYPPLHAPSYLRDHVDRIRTLQRIPCAVGNRENFYDDEYMPVVHELMKKTLTETYGWPDSFRREDWARDAEDVWEQAFDEGEAA